MVGVIRELAMNCPDSAHCCPPALGDQFPWPSQFRCPSCRDGGRFLRRGESCGYIEGGEWPSHLGTSQSVLISTSNQAHPCRDCAKKHFVAKDSDLSNTHCYVDSVVSKRKEAGKTTPSSAALTLNLTLKLSTHSNSQSQNIFGAIFLLI